MNSGELRFSFTGCSPCATCQPRSTGRHALHMPQQSGGPHPDEAGQLRTVKVALENRFAGQVSEETIARELDEGLHAFDGAPVRAFIPVLLQKRVTDRLRDISPA